MRRGPEVETEGMYFSRGGFTKSSGKRAGFEMFTVLPGEIMTLSGVPILTVSYHDIELRFRGLGF